ncbi:MAG: ribonuclease Z [Candidatus Micrarchaeota archaeon]|nr:ribonuclease Z [Candidatus Micrarchaeota archaeon]
MDKIKVKFFGTNGWYTTETGHTVCATISFGKSTIILDAGEGLTRLEKEKNGKRKFFLFLSHFHLDHVFGLHVLPKLTKMKKIKIFGQPGTKKILAQLLNHPFTASPKELEEIGLEVDIHEISPWKKKKIGENIEVIAAPLVHADPCFGFRFELGSKKIAYCTDTGSCKNIYLLAKNADMLITECGLLPGQKTSSDWPHMSPEAAAKIAKKAKCKMLCLTHFIAHLYKTKETREEAQRAAQKIFQPTVAAHDGMELEI